MKILDIFFKYRINVSLLVFTICLIGFVPNLTVQTVLVSASFSLLWTFIYLYNKVTDWGEDAHNVAGFPIDQKNSKAVLILSYICLFLPVPYLLQWLDLLGLYAILALVLGYGYSKKVKLFRKDFRLKNVLFVKNITSAACWASMGAFVPFLYYNAEWSIYLAFMWLNLFTLVLAIEIVWDIRDIEGDLKEGVRTLPNTIGLFYSKLICLVPVIIFFVWRFWADQLSAVYFVAYVLTIISIATVKKTSHPYVFQALVLIWMFANIIYVYQNVS